MGITRLKVSNFKSFDELNLELRPLNIVVGANAAGKSNFLEIFRFLRDLAESGLENAVSLQGGIGYLANLKSSSSRPISVQVTPQSSTVEGQIYWVGRAKEETWVAYVRGATYSLDLEVAGTQQGFVILREEIAYPCELRPVGSNEPGELHEFLVSREGSHIKRKDPPYATALAFPGFTDISTSLSPSESLLGRSNVPIIPDIALFDFDPRLPKKATPITGRAELDPDGGNLAIVLKSVLSDPERAAQFSRLLRDLLPFVEDLRVENLADKSLLFLLRETYSSRDYLPAAFLSSGTIHIVALLLSLYFDKADVTVIEEPERNIHPHLISRVVAMMKDASATRQIVTTTHNPELVKHADLADLLLVIRDENGFSRITRPAENEELKIFLSNELGVDELYVQNLLGAGHGV